MNILYLDESFGHIVHPLCLQTPSCRLFDMDSICVNLFCLYRVYLASSKRKCGYMDEA